MRTVYRPSCCLVMVILLACGCNGRSAPSLMPTLEAPTTDSSSPNHQLLLGLYDIELDSATGTAEIAPLRGPSFQANIVQYLQPPLGSPANLKVTINPDGTDFAAGIFDLNISITHPFPGTNLRGFDVRGIVLGEKGTCLSQFDYDMQYPKPTETRLLNPDGYTRWWNAVEFLTPGVFGYTPTLMGSGTPKATVNGYKYFADDLAPEDPPDIDPETRGTFSTQTPAGEPNTLTRQFVIRFPVVAGVPKIKFQYAICASWAPPAPGTPPPAPVDAYPIQANCPEPYRIALSVHPSSTAYYTSAQAGGDLVLNIEIFDWQATDHPNGVPGELGCVRLESPTLWTGLVDPIASGNPYPTDNSTSSAWRVEIKHVTPMAEEQDIFLTAQSADPTSYEPPKPGSAIYPGGAILAAYYLYTVKLPGNTPPQIGDIYGPGKYAPGATLVYTLTSMTDLQDGPNLTVTWDFDGDEVFNDDEDGSDTNKKGSFTFNGPGTYFVQCRVTDTQGAYTDSNVLEVSEISLPYEDPMDTSTQTLWHVENGLFGLHLSPLEWNVQGDHWSSSSSTTGSYDDDMNTLLISPAIPAGAKDKVVLTLTHRYDTEGGFDTGWVYYRINDGSWTAVGGLYEDTSAGYPSYVENTHFITGLNPGDLIELAFLFASDSSVSYYHGWDITHLLLVDNEPPDIEGIYGPPDLDFLGPVTYSTVATDLDGITEYMWSVGPDGDPPLYDDPGDGMGSVDVVFPADGKYDIWVRVTDGGDPPMSSTCGPYNVSIFSQNPDAFFSDDFDDDTGAWTFTGGIDDGSYQDFWHIDTAQSFMSNVGPDGCFSEQAMPTVPKTAARTIIFPNSPLDTIFKVRHTLWADEGGAVEPYDGQWVEIDGDLVEPMFGFLYTDNGGAWPHGYWVGVTGDWVISTFNLGTSYNNGLPHTIAFHQYSSDPFSNCDPLAGWQITYVELYLND